MLHLQWLRELLNWLSLPALLLLAGIFIKRRLFRDFPLFFAYLSVAAAVDVVRLIAYAASSYRVYFFVYWISDVVLTIFNFFAIYEVFLGRLFSGFHKIRAYRTIFPVIATAITLLAWLTTLQAPNKYAVFMIAARTFDFVRVSVLAFFLLLMQFMRRSWTRYTFGIALGFGIHAVACLVTEAMWTFSGYHRVAIGQLPLIGFEVACYMWLFFFWKPEPASGISSDSAMPELLHQARTWETMLKAWLGPGKK
jgi:hypothetical protein